ncbi:Uncharacterized protein APZ42_029000 [Daphnia magna]|uniref:Uncharacterized protein n=1 Tax=Daphnia magna TaxID=35525 RepID=A0A164PZY3_9CRUS|nr:Uncharacterized protein APZ42_029000 [Daphnia magna]
MCTSPEEDVAGPSWEEVIASEEDDCDEESEDVEAGLHQREPGPPSGSTPIPLTGQSTWALWKTEYFRNWSETANGKIHAICKLYNVFFMGPWKAFSNFLLYLSRFYVELFNKFLKSLNTSYQLHITAFARERKVSPKHQAKMDKYLTRAFVTGNIPLLFTRNEDFIKFLKLRIPGFVPPTDFTMRRRHVPNEYDCIKKIVEPKIGQCTAVTNILDIWSSKHMCCFIGFNLKAVVRVLTDNGSNMFKALKVQFPEPSDPIPQSFDGSLESPLVEEEDEMVQLKLSDFTFGALTELLSINPDVDEEWLGLKKDLDDSYIFPEGQLLVQNLGRMKPVSFVVEDGLKVLDPTAVSAVQRAVDIINLIRKIAILDPRFKTDWIASSRLNEEDVLDCVKSELVYRFRQTKDESPIVPDAHSPGWPLLNQNQIRYDSPTGQPESKILFIKYDRLLLTFFVKKRKVIFPFSSKTRLREPFDLQRALHEFDALHPCSGMMDLSLYSNHHVKNSHGTGWQSSQCKSLCNMEEKQCNNYPVQYPTQKSEH